MSAFVTSLSYCACSEDEEGESGKPKAGAKRAKKEKDPNAPKRPMTAFMLWLGANRERIKVIDLTASSSLPLRVVSRDELSHESWR